MPSADITGSSTTNQADVDVDVQPHRAQTTLDCFSELAQGLTPCPGRKNAYWLAAVTDELNWDQERPVKNMMRPLEDTARAGESDRW